jgi:hypothetical protein
MCLAKRFAETTLPTYGDCPNCKKELIWGDLIQAAKLRQTFLIEGVEGGTVIEEDPEEDDYNEDEYSSMDEIDTTIAVIDPSTEEEISTTTIHTTIENYSVLQEIGNDITDEETDMATNKKTVIEIKDDDDDCGTFSDSSTVTVINLT